MDKLYKGPIKVYPNTFNIVQMAYALDSDSYKVQYTVLTYESDKCNIANVDTFKEFTDFYDRNGNLVVLTPKNNILKLITPGVYRFIYNGTGDPVNDVVLNYMDDPIAVNYTVGMEYL